MSTEEMVNQLKGAIGNAGETGCLLNMGITMLY